MEGRKKWFPRLLYGAMGGSLLSATAALLCGIPEILPETEMLMRLIIPILFWTGLMIQQGCIWGANCIRRHCFSQDVGGRVPGLFHFFATPAGKTADLALAAAVVLTIVSNMFSMPEIVQYVFLFLTVFFLYMHAICNGKNFIYKYTFQQRGYENVKL